MRLKTMTAQEVTGLFLFGVLLAVGIYDVIAGHFGGHKATISYVIQGWSQQYPILTILSGIVLGHLFWPIAPDRLPLAPPPPTSSH